MLKPVSGAAKAATAVGAATGGVNSLKPAATTLSSPSPVVPKVATTANSTTGLSSTAVPVVVPAAAAAATAGTSGLVNAASIKKLDASTAVPDALLEGVKCKKKVQGMYTLSTSTAFSFTCISMNLAVTIRSAALAWFSL
jgi:hypothetical protein